MKERPILFSAPMVRAILAGRKTQTRRLMKPQPANDIAPHALPNPSVQGWISSLRHKHGPTTAHLCPYGAPGDRLWVKETWRAEAAFDHLPPRDLPPGTIFQHVAEAPERVAHWGKTRTAIHMIRRASRITLEVTGVRVERLQAISDEDAKAEGARHFPDLPVGPIGHYSPLRWSMEDPENTDQCLGAPRWAFANLWQKLNGDDSWDLNPWVWIVEFKLVTL